MNADQTTNPEAQSGALGAVAELDVLTAQGVHGRRNSEAIRSYDFRQSGFLAPSELRRIRHRSEQFIRALGARLANFLRLEFAIELDRLQIVGYQKFTEGLSSPTHITLFRIEPLKGVGLLVIPPRLGLGLVDRMLGGPGKMAETTRDLSEIEVALVDQIAALVINEWCTHWPEMGDMRPEFLGQESNSRFLETAPADTAMLVLTLNAGVGESSEPIQLALPYSAVEPLVRLVCPAGLPGTTTAASVELPPKWNPELNEVKVPVVAEWQGLRLSAGEIARLAEGKVLLLDSHCTAQVQLRFNQVPKFLGRPGTRLGQWAVELTAAVAS